MGQPEAFECYVLPREATPTQNVKVDLFLNEFKCNQVK